MRRIHLLSTAATLAAALVAMPALAQRSGAMDEMQRERANPAMPAVPMQNRTAADVDSMGRQDAMQLLTQAEAVATAALREPVAAA